MRASSRIASDAKVPSEPRLPPVSVDGIGPVRRNQVLFEQHASQSRSQSGLGALANRHPSPCSRSSARQRRFNLNQSKLRIGHPGGAFGPKSREASGSAPSIQQRSAEADDGPRIFKIVSQRQRPELRSMSRRASAPEILGTVARRDSCHPCFSAKVSSKPTKPRAPDSHR